ncbi:MAG: hypothetical protein IJ666_01885 [Ruminococcus sp.]|nr:hypothetical protein [Ruminococcus sp.]
MAKSNEKDFEKILNSIFGKNQKTPEKVSGLVELYSDDVYWEGAPKSNPEIAAEEDDINVPMQIDIYTGLDAASKHIHMGFDITPKDRYLVETKIQGLEDTVDLLDDRDNLCGKMKLVKSEMENVYFLTAKCGSLGVTSSNNINYCLVFRDSSSRVIRKKIQLDVKTPEYTDNCLCIDFGTSNTTAGAFLTHGYVNNICVNSVNNGTVKVGAENIVRFDTQGNGGNYAPLIPTIVSVKSCADGKAEYRFGYEAFRKLKKNNYCPKESFFMEIKRWVTDCNCDTELIDEDGNRLKISRKEIIKKYLLYVIAEAEQQFKCKFMRLHISAPVKLKEKYLCVFDELLSSEGYVLEREHAIDEGIAVLYNQINNDIQDVVSGKNKEISRKKLIIDCGGGTSDLASCSYDISYDEEIVDIEINTSYINGDFNFGGNNLTYRIMQYMKIVYAYYYKTGGKRLGLEDIISVSPEQMIKNIEEHDDEKEAAEQYRRIYENFEKVYADAEEIIPTQFEKYRSRSTDIYNNVKNNFYFLWNIADQMKKKFYQYNTTSRYTIGMEKDNKDNDLFVDTDLTWQIAVHKGDKYIKENYPDVVFNAKEIAWILTGDIYYLIHKFLNNLYNEDELNTFDGIKLSGQSTNIDTFKMALKEFLPGKKIDIRLSPTEEEFELKLACLKGAMRYMQALQNAEIDVVLNNDTDAIPVDVKITSNGETKLMISSKDGWEQQPVSKRITSATEKLNFYLSDSDRNIEQPYEFDCKKHIQNLSEMKLSEISEITGGYVEQDFLDRLNPLNKTSRMYAVVYLNHEEWGFGVMVIKAESDGSYECSEPEVCSFETDISQKTFFDGVH